MCTGCARGGCGVCTECVQGRWGGGTVVCTGDEGSVREGALCAKGGLGMCTGGMQGVVQGCAESVQGTCWGFRVCTGGAGVFKGGVGFAGVCTEGVQRVHGRYTGAAGSVRWRCRRVAEICTGECTGAADFAQAGAGVCTGRVQSLRKGVPGLHRGCRCVHRVCMEGDAGYARWVQSVHGLCAGRVQGVHGGCAQWGSAAFAQGVHKGVQGVCKEGGRGA